MEKMVKIKKTIIPIIFLLVAFLFLTYVHATQETDWIVREYNKRDRNVEESALSLLALNKQLGSVAQLSSAEIKLKNYLDSCIPANNCNNKDVALATWALKNIGDESETLDAATNWLINSRTIFAPDTEADDWLVQIISQSSGDCVVNNTETGGERIISVSADYTPWQSVKDLVTQNTNSLAINCSPLASVNSISLIKKKTISNIVNYFIIEEIQNQKSVGVQLGIPCWGSAFRSTCNKDATAYVLLALSKQGKSVEPTWLEQQTTTAFEGAVLYDVTDRQEYFSALQSSQSQSGYWQPVDVATTSLIYSLLPPESTTAKKALEWIQGQRAQEGCWPKPSNLCNLKSTSAATYTIARSTSPTPPPGNETRPSPSDRTVLEDCDEPCLDGDGCICPLNECRRSFVDEDETCGGPKTTPPPTPQPPGTYCVTERLCDGQLDILGRCEDTPGDDCPVGDTGADDGTGTGTGTGGTEGVTPETQRRDTTTEDDEGLGTLFWLLMVVAALIALIGGSYLAYKKGLIKFKKKPAPEYKPRMKTTVGSETPQAYQPRMRIEKKQHPVKKFLDKDLDKSIEELERLLKS